MDYLKEESEEKIDLSNIQNSYDYPYFLFY